MSTTVLQGRWDEFYLPALNTLTVVAATGGQCDVARLGARPGDDPVGTTAVDSGDTAVIGPFGTTTRHRITCFNGSVAYTIDPAELAAAGKIVPATSDASADLVELSGDGAPVAAVKGTVVVDPAGANNQLTFTAVLYGEEGNDISIEYRDPGANNASLSVEVIHKAIIFHLATGAGGAITTTSDQIQAALLASGPASALVTAAETGGDTGVGVVTAMAAASPVNGAGTGANVAGPGSRYTDVTSSPAKLYLNGGTKALPVWKIVTSAA